MPSVSAIREFKAQYRNALNSLPVDEELATKIVAEANYAFSLNRNVLHSLEPEVIASIGENLFAEIISESQPGSTERSSGNSPENLVTVN